MTRKLGTVTIMLGLLLLAAAFFLTAYNFHSQKTAGQMSADALVRLKTQEEQGTDESKASSSETVIPDYVLDPGMDMPTVTIDGNDYIGTLEIPAIEKELPIMSEWSYPKLKLSPCRYKGSAYLDDLIIAAHNYETHFGLIKNLSQNDVVIFTDTNDNVFRYRVAEVEVLPGTAVEEMSGGDWDLTLFTCTPGGQTRVTVRCLREKEIGG